MHVGRWMSPMTDMLIIVCPDVLKNRRVKKGHFLIEGRLQIATDVLEMPTLLAASTILSSLLQHTYII